MGNRHSYRNWNNRLRSIIHLAGGQMRGRNSKPKSLTLIPQSKTRIKNGFFHLWRNRKVILPSGSRHPRLTSLWSDTSAYCSQLNTNSKNATGNIFTVKGIVGAIGSGALKSKFV